MVAFCLSRFRDNSYVSCGDGQDCTCKFVHTAATQAVSLTLFMSMWRIKDSTHERAIWGPKHKSSLIPCRWHLTDSFRFRLRAKMASACYKCERNDSGGGNKADAWGRLMTLGAWLASPLNCHSCFQSSLSLSCWCDKSWHRFPWDSSGHGILRTSKFWWTCTTN